MNNIYRHGELLLLPIKNASMINAVKKQDYIVTNLVHKKDYDKHDTLTIRKGIYRVLKKKEYDPFTKTIREIWD